MKDGVTLTSTTSRNGLGLKVAISKDLVLAVCIQLLEAKSRSLRWTRQLHDRRSALYWRNLQQVLEHAQRTPDLNLIGSESGVRFSRLYSEERTREIHFTFPITVDE